MPKSEKKQPRLNQDGFNPEKDRGGRILPGKKWRVFNFVVEVAVESPGTVDEEEAAEDAAEFITSVGRTAGRVHSSFCSITRSDEYGAHRPPGSVVFTRDYPTGEKAELQLPRGIVNKDDYPNVTKPQKAKPKKVQTKPKKKKARF